VLEDSLDFAFVAAFTEPTSLHLLSAKDEVNPVHAGFGRLYFGFATVCLPSFVTISSST